MNNTANEQHHLLAGSLLAPEGIRGEDIFLQNFACEGLPVHYMNNLATRGKKAKYDDAAYFVDQEDMAFSLVEFPAILWYNV